jgi:hypothetical protein
MAKLRCQFDRLSIDELDVKILNWSSPQTPVTIDVGAILQVSVPKVLSWDNIVVSSNLPNCPEIHTTSTVSHTSFKILVDL